MKGKIAMTILLSLIAAGCGGTKTVVKTVAESSSSEQAPRDVYDITCGDLRSPEGAEEFVNGVIDEINLPLDRQRLTEVIASEVVYMCKASGNEDYRPAEDIVDGFDQ